jgi:hypothetical protein
VTTNSESWRQGPTAQNPITNVVLRDASLNAARRSGGMPGSGGPRRGCGEGPTRPSHPAGAATTVTECHVVRVRTLAPVQSSFRSPTPTEAVAAAQIEFEQRRM